MLLRVGIIMFSLFTTIITASVLKSRSQQLEAPIFLNNIRAALREILRQNPITPMVAMTKAQKARKILVLSTTPSTTHIEGFQQKSSPLGPDFTNSVFLSASKLLLIAANPVHVQSNGPHLLSNFKALSRIPDYYSVLDYYSIEHQPVKGQIYENALFKRNDIFRLLQPAVTFNSQRPRRKPVFGTASSEALSSGRTTYLGIETKDVLVVKILPFSDDTYPPFSGDFFSQPVPQLFVQDKSHFLSKEVQSLSSHSSNQIKSYLTSLLLLQQSIPIAKVLQILQKNALQGQPRPLIHLKMGTNELLSTLLLPLQPSIQRIRLLKHRQNVQSLPSFPRPPVLLLFQETSKAQMRRQPIAKVINQPDFLHVLSQLSHHIQIPLASQRILKWLLQSPTQYASQKQFQQKPQQGLERIHKLPVKQQLPLVEPQIKQELFSSRMSLPPVHGLQQYSTIKPSHFYRSSPQIFDERRDHRLTSQRARPDQGTYTHQPKVRKLRRLLRRRRGTEQLISQKERELNSSSNEDIEQIKRKYDIEEEVFVTKVNGELPDVYHLPPTPSAPHYPNKYPSEHNGSPHISHPHNGYVPDSHGGYKPPHVHSGIAGIPNRPYPVREHGKGLVYGISRLAGKLAEKASRVANVIGKTTGEVLGESAALLSNAGNALFEAVKGPPASHTVASGLHVTVPHYDHVKEHKFGVHLSLGIDSDMISKPHGYNKMPPQTIVRPYFHITSTPLYQSQHNPGYFKHPTHSFHKIPKGNAEGIYSSGSKFKLTGDGFLVDEHHSGPHLPEYEDTHGIKHPGHEDTENHGYEVVDHTENPGHHITYEIHDPPEHHYHIKDKAKPEFHQQGYPIDDQHLGPHLPGAEHGDDIKHVYHGPGEHFENVGYDIVHETHDHPNPHYYNTEETKGIFHEKGHNIKDVSTGHFPTGFKPEITKGGFLKDELPSFSHFPEYADNYGVNFDHDGAGEYNYDIDYGLDDPLKHLYINDGIEPALDLAPKPGYYPDDIHTHPERQIPYTPGRPCETPRQKFHLFSDRKYFKPGPQLYNSLCIPYYELRRRKIVS